MKLNQIRPALSIRLAATAAALLLSQYSIAAGTDPDTVVENTVTVNFSVNSQPQTPAEDTVDFRVDRLVAFTVTRRGSALTQTTAGDTEVFVEYLVTNLSNGDLGFLLSEANQATGAGDIYTGDGGDTGVEMNNLDIRTSTDADTEPNPTFTSVTGGALDSLAEDASIRVRVYADTPADAPNLGIAGIELSATAAEPGTGAATLLSESSTWNEDTVDNLFANTSGADTGGNATETAVDGFEIQSAAVTVSKTQSVVATPDNNGLAIPGSEVQYTILIENTGSVAAEGIVIADAIDADVAFNGSLTVDGTPCTGDAADGDGCALTGADSDSLGGTLTIDSEADGTTPLTVPAGGNMEVIFNVLIPN